MSDKELAGQLLMLGVDTEDEPPLVVNDFLKDAIRDYHIGGVILFKNSFPNQSPDTTGRATATAVHELTDQLQEVSKGSTTHHLPLFISMDQEGGGENPLSTGVSQIPSAIFFGATRDAGLTRASAKALGQQLRSLGVNMVLAPVADINTDVANDVIGRRAFGANRDIVTPLATAFAQGLREANIIPVAKHFPGHGSSGEDPQWVLPKVGYRDPALLDQYALAPFKALIDAGVPAIMTAHLLVEMEDQENPATLSPDVTAGLLRKKLGFSGITLTDDLSAMKAITLDGKGGRRNRSSVAYSALQAGNDVLLYAKLGIPKKGASVEMSEADLKKVYANLITFIGSSQGRRTVRAAVERIVQQKLALIPFVPVTPVAEPRPVWLIEEHLRILEAGNALAEQVAQDSAVLIWEEGTFDRTKSKYFRDGHGPLSPTVITADASRVVLALPAVHKADDELTARLGSTWLGPARRVPLVYGWRRQSLDTATKEWGTKVEIMFTRPNGQMTFAEGAINAKAKAIVDEVRKQPTDVLVFVVVTRDQAEVLRRTIDAVPKALHIVVVFCREPYFIPKSLFSSAGQQSTVLWASPFPTFQTVVSLLLGEVQPKGVAYLPSSIPGIIARDVAIDAPVFGVEDRLDTFSARLREARRHWKPLAAVILVTWTLMLALDLLVTVRRRQRGPITPPWGFLVLRNGWRFALAAFVAAILVLSPNVISAAAATSASMSYLLMVGVASLLGGGIATGAWEGVIRGAVAAERSRPGEQRRWPRRPDAPQLRLPAPHENNVWYSTTGDPKGAADGDTAIVFVHGIFSDSHSCWLYVDPSGVRHSEYWPRLVASDGRFRGASIFLGGYYTATDSGAYEIASCASELWAALGRRGADGTASVMDKDRIVFVAHSTGGIVVRYILDRWAESLSHKAVGVVLMASPSYGSGFANHLDWLARLYRQSLGLQLKWGSWSLRDLDGRFRDLVANRRYPRILGAEAYENRFVFHLKWLPGGTQVVTKESAGRYFGDARCMSGTNHFSIVKPHDATHPAHQFLVDFWTRFNAVD